MRQIDHMVAAAESIIALRGKHKRATAKCRELAQENAALREEVQALSVHKRQAKTFRQQLRALQSAHYRLHRENQNLADFIVWAAQNPDAAHSLLRSLPPANPAHPIPGGNEVRLACHPLAGMPTMSAEVLQVGEATFVRISRDTASGRLYGWLPLRGPWSRQ